MNARVSDRLRMVEHQVVARGIDDPVVVSAFSAVPREAFVAPEAVRFAYDDRALPIAEGQTISQPYIVALMTEAAEIGPADRVLEVGTGSGYQAAILSRIAAEVFSIERHPALADEARRRFEELGYDNIHVRVGDGTLGWEAQAPFDAILVTAGGPEAIPPALLEQLAPGGRLIIPAGATPEGQELWRIRRSGDGAVVVREALAPVRFVPLIGEAGWRPEGETARSRPPRPTGIPERMAAAGEAFLDLEEVDLEPLIDRIGGARLVLLGEASHGTSQFYRLRARITRELIEKRGFDFVAVEADWPDAAEIDAYVRHHRRTGVGHKPFQRFPRWMWANTEVLDFARWLRSWNATYMEQEPGRMAGFHGLDLYSMYTSMDAVLHYLDDVDPEAARVARDRYACLTPWRNDPVLYGRAVTSGSIDRCEDEVVAILTDLMDRRFDYVGRDGTRFADALQNARLVANAERYYRVMYRGSVASWNLRDQHMSDTLGLLLGLHGTGSRGIVWAHNSHLGDARHTAMRDRGEHNLGQLVKQEFGRSAYAVGFGTHTGTVAAASEWGGTMERMTIRPSHASSYERLAHDSGVPAFLLPLRDASDRALSTALLDWRLERAIGVIYRPDTELQSHYFSACLPRQFDEWIWFDRTDAVTPLGPEHGTTALEDGPAETYPFGL